MDNATTSNKKTSIAEKERKHVWYLSSFLRVGPIPSHNLLEQLLEWEDNLSIQLTVYTVTGT